MGAELCRSKRSTTFSWAHDGDKAGGNWIELRPGGELATKWGGGSWECTSCDPAVLDLTFGAMRHVCRLRGEEGKFLVEQRFLRRSGQIASNPKVKGLEVMSAGWLIEPIGVHHIRPGKQKSNASAMKTVQGKLQAAEVAEEKFKSAEKAALEAAEAAAAAAQTAAEMEKLAKKAEAAKSQAFELAQQKRKEAEVAVAKMDKTGLSRFGFGTPKPKRTQDTTEETGSAEKRLRVVQTTTSEDNETLGDSCSTLDALRVEDAVGEGGPR